MMLIANNGEAIKKERTQRAWSQQQLAEVADLSVRTIQRLEGGSKASFETVQALAAAFNLDVCDLLEDTPREVDGSAQPIFFLPRTTSGLEITQIVCAAEARRQVYDEPCDEREVELIGDFLQDLHDRGLIWSEVEPREKVETAHHYTQLISGLSELGYWVFAGQTTLRFHFPDHVPAAQKGPLSLTCGNVVILRTDSPKIIRSPPSGPLVAVRAVSETNHLAI